MRLKDRIDLFVQTPEVSAWYKAAHLKPRTRQNYALRLLQLFDKMEIQPGEFLEECNSNRKQILSRIKTTLSEVREHSASIAHQQRAALVHFVSFYQDQFDEPIAINYKVNVTSNRTKMMKDTCPSVHQLEADALHRAPPIIAAIGPNARNRQMNSSANSACLKFLAPYPH